jgi:hypothetical protein
MTTNLEQLAVAKDITEEWFTCLSDAVLDNISQQIKQEHNYLVCAYIEIVELYVTRILPGLNEFETAEAFIDYNTILTESKLLVIFFFNIYCHIISELTFYHLGSERSSSRLQEIS